MTCAFESLWGEERAWNGKLRASERVYMFLAGSVVGGKCTSLRTEGLSRGELVYIPFLELKFSSPAGRLHKLRKHSTMTLEEGERCQARGLWWLLGEGLLELAQVDMQWQGDPRHLVQYLSLAEIANSVRHNRLAFFLTPLVCSQCILTY